MHQPKTEELFPLSRIATFDVGVIGTRKHQVVGLLEADVTHARSRLRELREATAQVISGSGDYELGRRRSPLLTAVFYRLPRPPDWQS